MPLSIRLMQMADIPFAMELKTLAGWNQCEEDWKGYLSFDPHGCFVAEMDGVPVATATTTSYEGKFAWIGMVLVHPSARRSGIGTAMLQNAIRHLTDNQAGCIKLDATPMGKKVYVPLGFEDEYEVTRYERSLPLMRHSSLPGLDGPTVEPLDAVLLEEIAVFDEVYFGAKRGKVLMEMYDRAGGYSGSIRDRNGIAGYLMAHRGSGAMQIGPWAAKDASLAEALLHAFTAALPESETAVLVDVPNPNAEGIRLVERWGFRVQRGFCRMMLGENRFPGKPAGIFGTCGAEKG